MRGNGWVITETSVSDDDFGVMVPVEANMLATHTIKFRMKDDDGNVYFIGFMSQKLHDSNHIFDPLDDFGMPGYGCTSIEVLNGNTWEAV